MIIDFQTQRRKQVQRSQVSHPRPHGSHQRSLRLIPAPANTWLPVSTAHGTDAPISPPALFRAPRETHLKRASQRASLKGPTPSTWHSVSGPHVAGSQSASNANDIKAPLCVSENGVMVQGTPTRLLRVYDYAIPAPCTGASGM